MTQLAAFLPFAEAMALRISTSEDVGGTVVTIDGRLDGEGVAELERVVRALAAPLRVDLAGLRSADEAGRQALRDLRARGVTLTRLSPYYRLVLGDAPPRSARPSRLDPEVQRTDRSRRGRRPGRG